MAKLAVPVHQAQTFSWSRESGKRVGVVEASTLGVVENGKRLSSRVYDDAADVGFELISTTGKKVLFVRSRDVRNKEEELVATVWSAVDHTEPLEVHVLNT